MCGFLAVLSWDGGCNWEVLEDWEACGAARGVMSTLRWVGPGPFLASLSSICVWNLTSVREHRGEVVWENLVRLKASHAPAFWIICIDQIVCRVRCSSPVLKWQRSGREPEWPVWIGMDETCRWCKEEISMSASVEWCEVVDLGRTVDCLLFHICTEMSVCYPEIHADVLVSEWGKEKDQENLSIMLHHFHVRMFVVPIK